MAEFLGGLTLSLSLKEEAFRILRGKGSFFQFDFEFFFIFFCAERRTIYLHPPHLALAPERRTSFCATMLLASGSKPRVLEYQRMPVFVLPEKKLHLARNFLCSPFNLETNLLVLGLAGEDEEREARAFKRVSHSSAG